jgi:hypothetical protein
MIETMTAAELRRLDKLLGDLCREYGRLSDDSRDEIRRQARDLGWALARIVDHYDHAG